MREVEHNIAATTFDQPVGLQKFREDYLANDRSELPVSVDAMKNYLKMASEVIHQIGSNHPIESTFFGGLKVLSSRIREIEGDRITSGTKHEFPKGLRVTSEDSKTVDIKSITTESYSTKNHFGVSGSTTVETMDGRKIRVPDPGAISEKTLPLIIRALASGKTSL